MTRPPRYRAAPMWTLMGLVECYSEKAALRNTSCILSERQDTGRVVIEDSVVAMRMVGQIPCSTF